MRVTAQRNAALEGCEHGAKQKARQTRTDYRTDHAASTPTAPVAKDRRPWLGRDLTEWLSAVRATVRDADAGKVPHSMMTVAYSIALFTDHREGTAYRAYPDLAADTGLSLKTIGALVRLLEAHGHLETTRTATVGRAKQYRLTIPNVGGRDAELRKLATSIQEGELRKLATCIQAKEAEVIEEVPGHISGSLEGELRKLATTNKDKDIGLDRDATRPNINSTYTPTVDARACAPGGATAATDSSDADSPPDDPPPLEAYDDLPFEEQHEGDEGEPIQDIAPDLTATEEIDRHATAAPPAPNEDDDYFPHDLDEAQPEPDPVRPPPVLPYREARVLHAYAIHTIDEGGDPVGRKVPVSIADEHAIDDAWLLEVIEGLVKKGFADHDAAASSVAVTAAGIAALWSTKWTDFRLVAKPIATSGEAKPITHKPVITDDDDHIPF
ncbi:MAG: hypothetical protein B7Y80_19360 [Hyphomicrobium sp. 32-62-53]|nr:MAG: hypothetical protein B7Z29_17845 [Hyphomicrobium sp. 12-62-95]OYX97578.1 MAG: hypothetical protein B7Y80_19360 [Hyphomicrobium sp. 32-62-53]